MPKYSPVHTRPSYIPLILALASMGVLIAGFMYFSKDNAQGQNEEVIMDHIPAKSVMPASTPKPVEAATDGVISIAKKLREEKNKEFTISLQYPSFGRGDSVDMSINDAMSEYMDKEVKTFKDNFFKAKKSQTDNIAIGEWSLNMDYRQVYQSSGVYVIIFSIEDREGTDGALKTRKIFMFDAKEQTMTPLDIAVE